MIKYAKGLRAKAQNVERFCNYMKTKQLDDIIIKVGTRSEEQILYAFGDATIEGDGFVK